jgi:CAAX protease family protein
MLLRPLLGFAAARCWLAHAGGHWSDYGLRRPRAWWQLLLQCLVLYALVWSTSRYLVTPLAAALQFNPGPSILDYVHGNAVTLAGWLAIGWGVGGFIEELLFRGFLLNRVEALLGGNAWAMAVAVLAQAVLFGLLHLYQGAAGALFAGIFAALYGVMYCAFGRNLWPLILVHGVWNSVGMIGLYTG